jgi:hypothetical protein
MIILKLGDSLEKGDEVYTWIDSECSEINWIEICQCLIGNLIDKNHVPARRSEAPALRKMQCGCLVKKHGKRTQMSSWDIEEER